MVHVSRVEPRGEAKLWLRFSDGVEGEIDLSGELWGEIFEPLKNQEFFASVQVHPELRTVFWPNGADFAPEFLHDLVSAATRGAA